MTTSTRLIAALVATLFLGSARANATPTVPSGPPIVINAILSTTGNGAFIGSSEQSALGIIERQVNASGGIHGRPLHFNVLDDQTNTQLDVQFTNDLASKNVPLFLGPNIPAGCFAVGPIIDKNGPIGFCLNPFAHPQPGSFQFASFSDSYDVAAATLRFFRERGFTRIAMMNATDGTGRDSDLTFLRAFGLPENRSLTLVAQEHYAPGDVSVAAQMADIKAKAPQALISYNTGAPFGTVLRGLHDDGIDIPVATSGGNMNFRQIDQYAQFLPTELLFGAQLSFAPGDVGPGPLRDKQLAFLAALKGAGVHPDAGYFTVWDPAQLAVDIMRHVPPDATPAMVRDYLSHLHGWVGSNGVYDFIGYPQRGIGVNSVLILRLDAASKSFVPASRRGGAKR